MRATGRFILYSSSWLQQDYGQIYPILKQLVAAGLATQSIEAQVGKPDRHVYQLTDNGLQELQRWLIEPVEPQVDRIEILLKLFFGQHMSLADNIRHVEEFYKLQQQLLQKYQTIAEQLKLKEADNPNAAYWLITASYKLHITQALIHWCEETLSQLRHKEVQKDSQNA